MRTEREILRLVVAAQVALWDAERAYEKAIGCEVETFEAVGEFAIDAENLTDADLDLLASQLRKGGELK